MDAFNRIDLNDICDDCKEFVDEVRENDGGNQKFFYWCLSEI